jgi:site-specific recombinase XerD
MRALSFKRHRFPGRGQAVRQGKGRKDRIVPLGRCAKRFGPRSSA